MRSFLAWTQRAHSLSVVHMRARAPLKFKHFIALIASTFTGLALSAACSGGSTVLVPCSTNADCVQYKLVCDAERGACRSCASDGECGSGVSCVQRRCEFATCQSDADCAASTDGRTT